MDFYSLACPRGEGAPTCALDAWVENLPNVFPASLLKDTEWGFAVVEAGHLLGLALLGGCVIVLNLRLLGVGIVSETPSALERTLRPWLWLGVAIVLSTGVLIGMLNPEKLYTSPAFFVKMVAMAAALIFSFGVSNRVAQAQGGVPMPTAIAGSAAFVLWLWSMGIFASAEGANPGSVHLIMAGYAILLAFGRAFARIAALAAVALLVAVYVVYGYLVLGGPFGEDFEGFMNVTKACNAAAAIVLVGLLGVEIFGQGKPGESSTEPADGQAAVVTGSAAAKLVATFSILTWVTVAAAGRWIGLS